jgi:hypothetical protein
MEILQSRNFQVIGLVIISVDYWLKMIGFYPGSSVMSKFKSLFD